MPLLGAEVSTKSEHETEEPTEAEHGSEHQAEAEVALG